MYGATIKYKKNIVDDIDSLGQRRFGQCRKYDWLQGQLYFDPELHGARPKNLIIEVSGDWLGEADKETKTLCPLNSDGYTQ